MKLENNNDGSMEDLVWATEELGDICCSARSAGTGTSLYMAWLGFELSTTHRLASLLFKLAPVNSLFDMGTAFDWQPDNTPTSNVGSPFHIYQGGDTLVGEITALYSGIVNIAGFDAIGDLYTNMFVDFTGLAGGGFVGDMSFNSDMDTLCLAGDLHPVPLPASLPFLLAGLGGFGLMRRTSRRRK